MDNFIKPPKCGEGDKAIIISSNPIQINKRVLLSKESLSNGK